MFVFTSGKKGWRCWLQNLIERFEILLDHLLKFYKWEPSFITKTLVTLKNRVIGLHCHFFGRQVKLIGRVSLGLGA